VSYKDKIVTDARFVILRELTLQVDGRLNELSLVRVLDAWGIDRTREWVRTQLNALAELGAVELVQSDPIAVAKITTLGRNHVAERAVIDGVTRPFEVD